MYIFLNLCPKICVFIKYNNALLTNISLLKQWPKNWAYGEIEKLHKLTYFSKNLDYLLHPTFLVSDPKGHMFCVKLGNLISPNFSVLICKVKVIKPCEKCEG